MSSTPREIGTLIVVILKANHLPNKRHIGKQDPYCVVTVNGEKRRTKAIKRGGQHPEWDEEVRFNLFEDTDDVLARSTRKDGSPPPLPPKSGPSLKAIKGGKLMKLACYADDSREPDLIGETDVDLTEVLTKGETDEWFTLSNKDKFAGKVYLELTFWSNEAPPEKKVVPGPSRPNKQYGGPGSFVPTGEDRTHHPQRSASYGPQPDLYVAPYEQPVQPDPIHTLSQGFGEMNVGRRRRQSAPYGPGPYAPHHPSASYFGLAGDGTQGYPYEYSNSGATHSGIYGTYSTSSSLTSPYENQPLSPNTSTMRGQRQSIPIASSGFMPVTQQPSTFSPLQPEPYHVSHAPQYPNHAPQQYPGHSAYSLQDASQGDPYLAGPNPGSYQHAYTYPPYTSPSTISATPLQHPASPPSSIGISTSTPYHPFPTMGGPDAPPNLNNSQTSVPVTVASSRPLPPQPIVYTQPVQPLDSPQQANNYSPALQPGDVSPRPHIPSHPLPVPPPPPPPPQMKYNPDAYDHHVSAMPVPPPPPPPQIGNGRSRRHSSLPQPPAAYVQQQHYSPIPSNGAAQQGEYTYDQFPPPPPPPLPIASPHNYQSGAPPLPPPPPPVDEWGTYRTQ